MSTFLYPENSYIYSQVIDIKIPRQKSKFCTFSFIPISVVLVSIHPDPMFVLNYY